MFLQQNHVTAGGANASITVGDVCELDVSLAKSLSSGSFLFVPEQIAV